MNPWKKKNEAIYFRNFIAHTQRTLLQSVLILPFTRNRLVRLLFPHFSVLEITLKERERKRTSSEMLPIHEHDSAVFKQQQTALQWKETSQGPGGTHDHRQVAANVRERDPAWPPWTSTHRDFAGERLLGHCPVLTWIHKANTRYSCYLKEAPQPGLNICV